MDGCVEMHEKLKKLCQEVTGKQRSILDDMVLCQANLISQISEALMDGNPPEKKRVKQCTLSMEDIKEMIHTARGRLVEIYKKESLMNEKEYLKDVQGRSVPSAVLNYIKKELKNVDEESNTPISRDKVEIMLNMIVYERVGGYCPSDLRPIFHELVQNPNPTAIVGKDGCHLLNLFLPEKVTCEPNHGGMGRGPFNLEPLKYPCDFDLLRLIHLDHM